MKYRMLLLMLLAGLSQPLTLKQMSKIWLVDGFNMRHFGEFAAKWKWKTQSIGWGLLDQVWVPFRAHTYFDGESSGDIKVITKFVVTDGFCQVRSRRIKSDLTTYFTPQSIPSWPQPVEPNQPPPVPVPSIYTPDPNALIIIVEGLYLQDPNDNALKSLLNLLKQETFR